MVGLHAGRLHSIEVFKSSLYVLHNAVFCMYPSLNALAKHGVTPTARCCHNHSLQCMTIWLLLVPHQPAVSIFCRCVPVWVVLKHQSLVRLLHLLR